MKDKICLVTGATSGIGEVTAKELAREGATVILLARNAAKAQKTKDMIMQETSNIDVDIIIADLSSMKQIRQAAEKFKANYSRLDVLVNNAGFVAGGERKVTEDGFEETFAVNHLAPFLLTGLLLDSLKASKEARIINLSSAAHNMGKPDFANLQMEKNYSAFKAYCNAKLDVILFTSELARRLKAYPNVTVNALHPGIIASNFSVDAGGLMEFGFKLIKPFLLSAEKGAETTIYLATAPEAAQYTGLYFAKKKPKKPNGLFINDANQKKLWDISEQLTGYHYNI